MQPYHNNTRSAQRMATRGRLQRYELNDLESYYHPPPEERRQVATYQGASRDSRYYEEMIVMQDKELENVDDSSDFGDPFLESQQWRDSEEINRPQIGREKSEASCRVSWCEHPGKRYGLCWAHGGVKKCCHRNCPKVALGTGEFCSIHEREISASTF